jgi:hypothetical protein
VVGEGTVTIGYVSLTGIDANDVIMTLTFEVVDHADTDTNAEIGFKEVNDEGGVCEHIYTDCVDTDCDKCGEKREAPGHSFTNYVAAGNATCTTDGTKTAKCDHCDATNTVTDAGSKLGHSYSNGFCTRCDAQQPGSAPIVPPAPSVCNHHAQTIPGYAATCTEPGLTEGKICSACGAIMVAQVQIPALGHTERMIPGVATTCTATGLTDGVKCAVCDEILVAQEEIAALAHDYESVVTAPNCIDGGNTTHTSRFCGHAYRDSYTEMRAHKFDVVTVVVEPTCTTLGSRRVDCAYEDCDSFYFANNVIPTIAHSYESKVTAPTCTEGGYTTYTCAECGHSYIADETVATGHSFGEWTASKEATRKEAGEEARACACGESESRATEPLECNFPWWIILLLILGATGVGVYFWQKKKRS